MNDHARIWFTTPDIETERAFIDEYVLDAVDRLDSHDSCEKFIFIRAGRDPSLDEGGVIIDIYGDPEEIIDQERERWDAAVEDGPLTEWEQTETDIPDGLADYYGEQGATLHEELRYLATQMALPALDTFESAPAPVDAVPEAEGEGVGWYRLLHLVCNHQGYSIDEEAEAMLKNLETSINTEAQIAGVDAAQERVDEYIDRLETLREDIEEHRDQS